jgi:segregation and condensation protein B
MYRIPIINIIMKKSSLIEALLFSRAEPWTYVELAKALNMGGQEALDAIAELEASMSDRGIVLVQANDSVTLGTHPEAHEILSKLYKEELSKGLSKASIETLSIVIYGDEVTRNKIDYIRGVNSGFILRSLLVRGLVERLSYPHDRKRFMYVPTTALLASHGAAKDEDLPEYTRIHTELNNASEGSETMEETNVEKE